MPPPEQTSYPTPASSREMWRLAWPFILSNSCWTLQIVLDRVLLSRSSTEAVGAGIAAVMMFWTALTLFQWTTMYASTFVAQYTGANQPLRVGAVVGQALWFGSVGTLIWGIVVWLTVHAFVLVYEEPTLSSTYGAQYDRYRANVRRWIPRLTPWSA